MGAISAPSSIPILRKYLNDSNRSVRETCEIALAKIEWDNSEEGKKHWNSGASSSEQYARIPHPLGSSRAYVLLYAFAIQDLHLH